MGRRTLDIAMAPAQEDADDLATPGFLGRAIRFSLGVFTLTLLDGPTGPLGAAAAARFPVTSGGFWIAIAALTVVTPWVVNELLGKDWGVRPSIVAWLGAALAAAAGWGLTGGPLAWPLGVYLAAWTTVFVVLLAPAFILAALLGTPGCEMRSYAHLKARLTGGDPGAVTCPGGIDFLDHVRFTK